MRLDLAQQKVLVVDDDDDMRQALQRWLSMMGYLARPAASVEEALVVLNEEDDIALLLLDLGLPGIHGHALLREIDRQQAPIPVVVVSGSKDAEDVITAFRHHAADYLTKPFNMDQLTAAIDRALKSRRAVAGTGPTMEDAVPSLGAGSGSVAAGDGWGFGGTARDPMPGASASRPAEGNHRAPVAERGKDTGNAGVRPAVAKLAGELRRGTAKLPALNPKIVQIKEVLDDPDASSDAVVRVLQEDPTLSAAVLRQANMGYYRLGSPVTTLREACVRLGNKSMYALALEVVMAGQFDARHEPFKSVLRGMWGNALLTARFCGELAPRVRERAEEMYLAGMLHNIGELVLLRLLSELGSAKDLSPAAIAEESEDVHESFGAALARSWKLGPKLEWIAGYHHHPRANPEADAERRQRHLVLAGWSLALRYGGPYLPGQSDIDPDPHLEQLGLAPQIIREDLGPLATRWLQSMRKA